MNAGYSHPQGLAHQERRFMERHVKGDPECSYEERGEQNNFQEGGEHPNQHDHVNSSQGELGDDNQEIDPAQKYC